MSSDTGHIFSYHGWSLLFWGAFSGWSLQDLFCIDFSVLSEFLTVWLKLPDQGIQVWFCTLAVYNCCWRLPCFLGKDYPQMVSSYCHLEAKSCLTCSQILWIVLPSSFALSQTAVDIWKEYPVLHRNCGDCSWNSNISVGVGRIHSGACGISQVLENQWSTISSKLG